MDKNAFFEHEAPKPETAEGLIERMERETGVRIDANNGDNPAMAGLFGAMARLMGKTPPCYTERDDVAVGMYLKMKDSPEERERESAMQSMVGIMLATGASPDDLHALSKKLHGKDGKTGG